MLKRTLVPVMTIALLGIASIGGIGHLRSTSLGVPTGLAPNALAKPLLSSVVASTLGTGQVDMKPVRLVIASIHLDARIEARGLDAKRNLDTARDANDAAWYDLGPAPGQPGNAIINGHVDWWSGDAVFSRLGRVRPGDVIQVVRADGGIVLFRITSLQRVAAGTRIPALFAPSGAATLTLITCAGVWNPLTLTNTERLLVSAAIA